MKSISLTIISILVTAITFGQGRNSSDVFISTSSNNHTSPVYTQEFPPLASGIPLRNSYASASSDEVMQYEGEHAIDKCASYRKMKIAGIVLSAVGSAMIVTGAVIRGAAYRSSTEGTINNYDYYNAMAGGGAMIGIGTLGLGAGIPLAIIGSVKTRRYCYGAQRPAY